MSKRDSYLLRIDPAILRALKVWAADELRSLNGQIEFLLRDALLRAGREPRGQRGPNSPPPPSSAEPAPSGENDC